MPYIHPLDIIALAWFLLCWITYALVADRKRFISPSLMQAADVYREAWMRRMLERDNRLVDSTLIGNLMSSVSLLCLYHHHYHRWPNRGHLRIRKIKHVKLKAYHPKPRHA